MSALPIRPGRRIFTARVNADHLMHTGTRYTAIVVIAGALAMGCRQMLTPTHREPVCERYDARHQIGIVVIDGRERLCRRR